MHVPFFPVVLTVQELPPPELPGGVGFGPAALVRTVGLEPLALGEAGFPGRPLAALGLFSL